jgi:hypothetical protein
MISCFAFSENKEIRRRVNAEKQKNEKSCRSVSYYYAWDQSGVYFFR